MKKLFLSSAAIFTLDLIRPILPVSAKKLRVAFIPTAADLYTEKQWMYDDRNKLIEMGFDVFDVDIKNKTEEKLLKELKNIDILFVSGGNTYFLLEKILQSGFDRVIKKLINQGVIYIGSSAGSVLACPTIEFIEDLDDRSEANLSTFTGLGLVDFLILPHYGDPKYDVRLNKIINKWKNKGYKIITLTNDQAIIVEGDSQKIVEVKS